MQLNTSMTRPQGHAPLRLSIARTPLFIVLALAMAAVLFPGGVSAAPEPEPLADDGVAAALELQASAEAGDRFGSHVAVSADEAIVSGGLTRWFDLSEQQPPETITTRSGPVAFANGRVLVADLSAGVFLYERTGAGWSETVVTSGVVGPVAFHGNDPVVVGQSGALYLFSRNNVGLFVSDRLGAGFRSVAADGDRIIAGRRAATIANPAGVVTLFTANDAGGFDISAILPSDSRAGDGFGSSVAVDGKRLVVGSVSGKAYVFDEDPVRGRIEHRLPVPRDAFGDGGTAFGLTVAAGGGRVLIGSPNGPESGIVAGAAAYIAEANALGNWQMTETMRSPTNQPGFASAVGISESGAVVGSPTVASESGRAWAFSTMAERETGHVQHVVSCLADRGRVDINIVNVEEGAAVYTVRFEGLAPRSRLVDEGGWWRSPITGRADGTYEVQVEREGVTLAEISVTVACDGAPQVASEPIQVMSACVGGKGYILFQFVNAESQGRSWVIHFAGVPNRSTSAESSGASVRATSGRADGVYGVRVMSEGQTIDVFAVRVQCDDDAGPV